MRNQLLNNRGKTARILAVIFLLTGAAGAIGQAPDEQYILGCANAYKENYTQAVDNFSMAIARNNSDEKLFIKRGAIYFELNQYKEAEADFNEANVILPHVADIWLARLYALQGEEKKSLEFLQDHLGSSFKLDADSIKKDPSFDRIQGGNGWYALWQTDWYNAKEKKIAEIKQLLRKRQFDHAITLLDEMITNDSDDPQLMILRGKTFIKQGNPAAAVGDLTSALNIDKTLTECYSFRAEANFDNGKFKDAIADYTKAIKAEPGNFKLYLDRGKSYAGQKQWDLAAKDMLFYLKYFPDDMQAVYQCGEYYYGGGDYINALKYFNRNVKDDPNNALYYLARGKTYLKTGTVKYAVNDLSMSLDLNPAVSDTWLFHGIALIQSGNTEDGCSSLHKAKSLGSTDAVRYISENCNR